MGADKALVEVDGERLIDRALTVLAELADDLVIARGAQPPLQIHGVREVTDPITDAGPLAGLAAGLAAARHELVAVVAVDLPEASAPVLRRCLTQLKASPDADAAVPVVDGRAQPLHAAYRRSLAPTLRARLEGPDRSLHGALGALAVAWLRPDAWSEIDPAGRFARNVNHPHDLDSGGGPAGLSAR